MKKKLLSLALASILSLTMSVTSFAQTISNKPVAQKSTSAQAVAFSNNSKNIADLKEGQTVRVPISTTKQLKGGITTNSVSFNNGYVEFKRIGNVVEYSIIVFDAYTNVAGDIEIRDITSGLDAGFKLISATVGSISYKALKGHTFRVTLSGYAYLLGKPVDSIFAQGQWTE